MSLYKVVQCPHCGVNYIAYREDNEYPKMRAVCSTCFMLMEVDNPFYNNSPEKEKGK